MLKATLKESFGDPVYNRWLIHFHDPNSKPWDVDFVGTIYRCKELQQLGYLDAYEFYYCESNTCEFVKMLFLDQWELMKFLTHIGNELRAQATRRQKGIWE